jgi:hypothetical protein
VNRVEVNTYKEKQVITPYLSDTNLHCNLVLHLARSFPVHCTVVFEMYHFILVVYTLAFFSKPAAGASIPRYFQRSPTTRHQLNVTQVQRELGCLVSKTTAIYGPDDRRYDNATSRWNIYAPPQIQIVVEPARESDISATVSVLGIIIQIPVADRSKGQILQ